MGYAWQSDDMRALPSTTSVLRSLHMQRMAALCYCPLFQSGSYASWGWVYGPALPAAAAAAPPEPIPFQEPPARPLRRTCNDFRIYRMLRSHFLKKKAWINAIFRIYRPFYRTRRRPGTGKTCSSLFIMLSLALLLLYAYCVLPAPSK